MTWSVYIILCSDKTLYTGISNDVASRFSHHSSGRGAKYFRGRKPLRLVYIEGRHDRASATKREYVIKKMTRAEKWHLIVSQENELRIESLPGDCACHRK